MHITNMFSRFPGFPRPVFAAPDMGFGGDDAFIEGGDDSEITDDDDNGGQDGGFDDDDGITNDRDSAFDTLFKQEGDDTTEDDDSDDGYDAEAVQTAMTERLTAGLASMRLTDDVIPEDFNPNDRASLLELMNSVQRQTARSTLQLMFDPVQTTLGSMARSLRREMRQTSQGSIENNNAESLLLQGIPAAADPAKRKVIDVFWAQARTKHPKDNRAAVIATRKAMQAVGMSFANETKPSGGGRGGLREGKSALDLFAPLPRQIKTAAAGRLKS